MKSRPTSRRFEARIPHPGAGVVRVFFIALLAACGGDGGATAPELPAAPRRVFVAADDSTLSVFDEAGAAISELRLSGKPVSVTASPDGRRVYVGLSRPGGVLEYDAESLTLMRTLPGLSMGLGLDVTPDGRTIVGTNQDAGLVTIVSLETGELLDTLRVGVSPQYVRVDPAGRKAYVPVFASDELVVVDVAGGSIASRIPLGPIEYGPAGIALSPDGGTAYVGTYSLDEYLQVVHVASGTVSNRIDVGAGTVDVDLTADGSAVLLAQPRRIAVIDRMTATMTDTVPVHAFALAVPDSGDAIYAVERILSFSQGYGNLHVIRMADPVQVTSLPLMHQLIAVAVNFEP